MRLINEQRAVLPKELGERGIALVVTLLVISLLTLVGLTFLTLSFAENIIAYNEIHATRAFGIAEAGLAHGRRYLPETAATTGFDPLLVGSSGTPPTSIPVAALQNLSSFGAGQGTYSVSVANNTAAYQAVTADPDPQDDTDSRVWITALGTYRDSTRTVRALVEVTTLLSPPAAIDSLDGSDSGDPTEFDFSGNAFQVTGYDTPPPQTAGTCGTAAAIKPGIAVESAPGLTELDSEIASNQENNIAGAGGDKSIAMEPFPTLAQLQALKAALIQQATVIWSGSTNISSDVGSPTSPVIAYADDHLDLQGNGDGYGILVVERRLRIRGTYKWEGLILLVGQGEFEIEGTAEVYGAVLAANTGSYSGNSGETRVTVKGNATVAYSSQALCRASTVMPTTILAWQQL
ncbi:MAG: PilX N-terminal domain-containing pilus assembly protein [candidate division NC10 bacterium]|nr:PilX N-terminal domain-containing pilus assembly protein [candidate division NC10 bacterium]